MVFDCAILRCRVFAGMLAIAIGKSRPEPATSSRTEIFRMKPGPLRISGMGIAKRSQ
jgi:hypothetical protein